MRRIEGRRRIACGLSGLLNTVEYFVHVDQHKLRASDHATIALLLAGDQKLVRDGRGKWNHREAKRNQDDCHADGSFTVGFTDKTVTRLVESGRAQVVKFDLRGRPVEVSWVPIIA